MDKASAYVKELSMGKDNSDRADRLAEALRANLRRRKAQSREVADTPPPPNDQNPRADG